MNSLQIRKLTYAALFLALAMVLPLLKARALKLEKRGQFWQLKNARKKDLDVLEKVGFKPQERFQA